MLFKSKLNLSCSNATNLKNSNTQYIHFEKCWFESFKNSDSTGSGTQLLFIPAVGRIDWSVASLSADSLPTKTFYNITQIYILRKYIRKWESGVKSFYIFFTRKTCRYDCFTLLFLSITYQMPTPPPSFYILIVEK